MNNANSTGTIILPSMSAKALWCGELCGQFSDGMWENAAPMDHWKFWCHLNVVVDANDEPRVVPKNRWEVKKTGYGIASLYPIIGDRMLNIGRMGLAMDKLRIHYNDGAVEIAKRLTDSTLEEIRACNWCDAYFAELNAAPGLLEQFNNTTYTMKDLREDVKNIKDAMKTAKRL